jgi:hypothetical protein
VAILTHVRGAVVATILLVLLAGCSGANDEPAPLRVAGYRASELRRPAIALQVGFGPGEFADFERAQLPELYAGSLLDALSAEAIVPVDLTISGSRIDRSAALTRARAVAADHALLVSATVTRGLRTYCRNGRRPFTTLVTAWTVTLELVRTDDGAVRLSAPAREDPDVEVDCDNPSASHRRTREQAVDESVRRAMAVLFRP